jgi:ribosome-associated protein
MEEQDELPSKTKRKQAMHALQDLGEALVKLNAQELARLSLPEPLSEAIIEAKRLTKHEAIRRQMQYIGRLMRQIDAEPIQAQLDAWRGNRDHEAARHHRLERWRDRLLVEEGAVTEFADAYPHADVQQLRNLVRNARRETELNKPPKSARLLFRMIREITRAGTLDGPPADNDNGGE